MFRRKYALRNRGFCPICETEVTFASTDAWLRDHYLCSGCGSIPREPALMEVLQAVYPNWRDAVIHESSPVFRGTSARLRRECRQYIPSYYYPGVPLGTIHEGFRCENLESLTFNDASIDIHVTQDVMEHVLHPQKAFAEIGRTLKPGGIHIFTVPLVNKWRPSKPRVTVDGAGNVVHLEKPVYHGNPIADGSLVCTDWGFDICEYILASSGLYTYVFHIDDLHKGIRAEFIEVLVTRKPVRAVSLEET